MEQDQYEQYQAQSQLQNEQAVAQQQQFAPQLFEQVQQHQAVLVEQTNPKKIVKDILLRLEGLEQLPDGTITQVSEPKMNKKGIDNIKFVLDSHINQNVILSHLVNDEIAHIMEAVGNDLVDDLALNWKNYGIRLKTDLDTINDAILTNIFMALKRAEGQNEKNWLGKIAVENITGHSGFQNQKKEGFLSKLKL